MTKARRITPAGFSVRADPRLFLYSERRMASLGGEFCSYCPSHPGGAAPFPGMGSLLSRRVRTVAPQTPGFKWNVIAAEALTSWSVADCPNPGRPHDGGLGSPWPGPSLRNRPLI
jgi:hypothetical protein